MRLGLPHSVEVEQSIIGGLLLNPETSELLVEHNVYSHDFYIPEHQKLCSVMLDMLQDDEAIDVKSVIARVDEKNLTHAVGGSSYLVELVSSGSTRAMVEQHIGILKELSKKRSLIQNANETIEMVMNGKNDLDDILDRTEKKTLEITRDRQGEDFESSYDVVDKVLENIKLMSEKGSAITGLKTGFMDLDRITTGLQNGDLIILGGRPSMGKTAFALSLANNVAYFNQKPVAFFSLEMPSEQLITRILTMESKLDGYALRTGNITNEIQWSDLSMASKKVKKTPIYIDDSSMIRTSDMFSKCRKLKDEHGLSAVFVDYIQLIEGTSGDSRQQQVSDISRQLKMLARELDVPVIALSQLSRQVEQRDNKRPMMSDLRESGAIEQDADIIGFLYRDSYYKQRGDNEDLDQQDTEIIELNIAKNRNGAIGNVDLVFEKHTNSFYNLERQYEE